MFMMFAHRRAVMSSVRSVLALGRSSVGGSISSVSARNRRTPRARTSIAAGVGAILTGAFFSLKLRSTQHDGCDEKQKQTVGFWRNFVSQNIVPKRAIASNQVQPKTESMDCGNKEDVARQILKYCGVKDENEINKIVEVMCQYLEDKKSGKIEVKKIRLINDSIHGPIKLTPLVYQIINTREFHRLKHLRQQGGTHYVYPGANHTRFEHSLGVYHIAGLFAHSLKEHLDEDKESAKNEHIKAMYKFEKEEILCAELAGLCHDLGHGPMSHMFESVMKEILKHKLKDEVKHEKISVNMFKRLLRNPKVLAEFVLENLTADHAELIGHMITPPPVSERKEQHRLFLYEIVANKETGIDVDKWDYYQRDCHYLGVLQDFEWKRTMLLGRIVLTTPDIHKKPKRDAELHIGFREKEMDNLYGMFRTRANMYRKACKHKTVKAVERMYMDAMVHAKDLKIVWASDEGKGHKSIEEAVMLALKEANLDWYITMTDSIVDVIMNAQQNEFNDEEIEQHNKAKKLLTRIEERDLYKCSAKKKIAKFCPQTDFMDRSHQAYNCICKCCACMLENDVNVRAAKKMQKEQCEQKHFEESIFKNLSLEEQSRIESKSNIWVEVAVIKHPSEEDSNPLDKVIFFERSKNPEKLQGINILDKEKARKQASMVVVPQAFVEYELRVYDKRDQRQRTESSCPDSDQKALKRAMKEAWKMYVSKMS